MSSTNFAQTIIDKLNASIGTNGGDYTDSTATNAMANVALAITEYLINNTEVTVSYVGIIPGTPPSPDPLTTDKFKIVGSVAPPSASSNFNEWLKQIETNIIAGFQLAPKGNNGLVFVQKPFLSAGISTQQETLKNIHVSNADNPQLKIWEAICEDIMNWINTIAINPTPSGALHPNVSSTGTAAITKITLS